MSGELVAKVITALIWYVFWQSLCAWCAYRLSGRWEAAVLCWVFLSYMHGICERLKRD